MKAAVTPPGVTLPSSATPPRLAVNVVHTPDVCNDYIPMDSVRTRFFWAMKFLASNDFYVVIDDHLAYDTTMLDDTPAWVSGWKSLAKDVAADPVLRNRVMFDIANEPDSRGVKWATGPKGVGMNTYYEQAMDAIHSVNPTALLLIEGCGQLGTVAMDWGDGYATDDAIVQAGGVESAKPFFQKATGLRGGRRWGSRRAQGPVHLATPTTRPPPAHTLRAHPHAPRAHPTPGADRC